MYLVLYPGTGVVFQANIALFEACCKEKIQQFEDAGSDEEDIWDEKDVTFAPDAQRRPRYGSASWRICKLNVLND